MMNIPKARVLLAVLILLFGLQSCAGMRNPAAPESPSQTSAPPVKPAPQAVDPAPAQPDDQARKHVEAGEYQKAISIYADAHRKQPNDTSFMREYAKCLDGIRSNAEVLFGKGDLPAAGALYYVLQTNYPKSKDVEQMLSFDNASLTARLNYCRKALTRQGFEEYRKGNLDRAIVLWQGLLAIDPDNSDMKEALRTAIQQQKNLQEKN
jgi:tetratricopeptide (TPR) repeat protein